MSLLTVETSSNHRTESVWLIIIAILVAAVFISYSSRLSNLDKMIKMLNEKVNNLESAIAKLKKQLERPSRDQNHIKFNQNMIISGPYSEDNIDNPDNLIENKPKISKLFDPRVRIHERHQQEKEKKESEKKDDKK